MLRVTISLTGTLLFVAGAVAQTGDVTTTSGQNHRGELGFMAPDTVVVTPAGGTPVPIPFSEVVQLNRVAESPAGTQPVKAWLSRDVGKVKVAGSGAIEGSQIKIQGAGWGMLGTHDSFHFVHQPLKGDGQLLTLTSRTCRRKDRTSSGH